MPKIVAAGIITGWEEIVCAENNHSFADGTVLAQIPEAGRPDF